MAEGNVRSMARQLVLGALQQLDDLQLLQMLQR